MKAKLFYVALALVLMFSLVAVTVPTTPVMAADLHVGPGETYSTIQDAIDDANPAGGDTIYVAAGIYYENVNVDKSLTLKGGAKPIINGDTTADGVPDGSCITISADVVTVDGFELTNGYNGIIGETDNSVIKNNVIHDNLNYVGSNGVGICLWGDNDYNRILDNRIYNNDRQGIFIGYGDDTKISTGNTISGNTIYNNGLYTQPNGPDASAYGIQLWNADSNIIGNNEVYGHDDWFPDPDGSPTFDFAQGIYLCASFNNSVTRNSLHDNNYGVGFWSSGRAVPSPESTTITFNNIAGNTGFGVKNYDAVTLYAKSNWWNSAYGPEDTTGSNECQSRPETGWNCLTCDQNALPVGKLGDAVSDYVDYCPWRLASVAAECFIATAAYGTSTAEQLDVLRDFRDQVLLQSAIGSRLVTLYYQLSPPLAEFISQNSLLKTVVRELLIDPIVSLVRLTKGIWGN